MSNKAKKVVSLEPLESRRMLAAGDLDLSFGTGGRLITQALSFQANDLAMQADGKIVAVGSLNGDFAVARLNANGTLDSTFGSGGIVTTNFGGNRGDTAHAVAIQPDGKVVVAGVRANTATLSSSFGDWDNFAVARYNINGTLDASFDGDGRRTIDFGFGRNGATALALTSDGKIIVAGYYDNQGFTPRRELAVARLFPNGAMDWSFGELVSVTPLRASGRLTTELNNDAEINAVIIQPDGKIVVGGRYDRDWWQVSENSRFMLARYHSNGTRDSSFDGDGVLTTAFPGGRAFVTDLSLQSDGRIIASGQAAGHVALARYNTNGSLDSSFNAGRGTLVTNLGAGSTADDVVAAHEGIYTIGSSSGNVLMMRYRYDGTLDPTFGSGGIVRIDFGGNDLGMSLVFNENKVTTIGRMSDQLRLTVSRHFRATPAVQVLSTDTIASEQWRPTRTNADTANIIFYRDQRLDFPTRVFYETSGTAVAEQDYTGLRATTLRFVEIPAGEQRAVVTIRAIDDARMEPTEMGIVSILPHLAYTLGAQTARTFTIRDNDTLDINFQPAGSPTPAGYLADTGAVFAAQAGGYTYGWDADNSAETRDRQAHADQRFDTLTHLQRNGANRRWELAVPNGSYRVTLAAGDPSYFDGNFRINVENVLAINHVPTTTARFSVQTVVVNVTDGRLTISNAPGAVNNKICFLAIGSADQAAPAPLLMSRPSGTPLTSLTRLEESRLELLL